MFIGPTTLFDCRTRGVGGLGTTRVLECTEPEYKGLLATAGLSSPNIARSDSGFSEIGPFADNARPEFK
jgi:hypothetical protein